MVRGGLSFFRIMATRRKQDPENSEILVDPIEGETSEINAVNINDLKFEEIELANLGNLLPHGIFVEGERLDTVELKPITPKMDRLLGSLYKNSRNRLIAIVGAFFPKVIESIGGRSLANIAEVTGISRQSTIIERMILGDVLTTILQIRVAVMGEEVDGQTICPIAINATCPNCGTKNDDDPAKGRPYHDLGTVKVRRLAELDQDLLVEVPLPDGVKIGDETITKVYMKPLKFFHAEKIAKSDEDAEDITMLYLMVAAIPESELYRNRRGQVFDDYLYDRLSFKDLKALRNAMQKLQPQPEMSIEMECYNCATEWVTGLEWGRLREFLFITPDSDDE